MSYPMMMPGGGMAYGGMPMQMSMQAQSMQAAPLPQQQEKPPLDENGEPSEELIAAAKRHVPIAYPFCCLPVGINWWIRHSLFLVLDLIAAGCIYYSTQVPFVKAKKTIFFNKDITLSEHVDTPMGIKEGMVNDYLKQGYQAFLATATTYGATAIFAFFVALIRRRSRQWKALGDEVYGQSVPNRGCPYFTIFVLRIIGAVSIGIIGYYAGRIVWNKESNDTSTSLAGASMNPRQGAYIACAALALMTFTNLIRLCKWPKRIIGGPRGRKIDRAEMGEGSDDEQCDDDD